MLGECLLISSLSGKASRRLVESRGLLRRKPGILYISLQVGLLFKLAVMLYLLIFVSIQHKRECPKNKTRIKNMVGVGIDQVTGKHLPNRLLITFIIGICFRVIMGLGSGASYSLIVDETNMYWSEFTFSFCVLLIYIVQNLSSGFPTKWDWNQSPQLQRLARKLKFCL